MLFCVEFFYCCMDFLWCGILLATKKQFNLKFYYEYERNEIIIIQKLVINLIFFYDKSNKKSP